MSSPVGPLFLGLFVSFSAFAAVPVSEIGRPIPSTTPVSQPQVPTVNAPAQLPARDVHYKMQLLEDEVRSMRGLLEEMNNEIRQLKKRQMDDYMDLDRRLSAILSGSSGAATISGAGTTSADRATGIGDAGKGSVGKTAAVVTPKASSSEDEARHYNEAYQQLKNGKVNEAVTAFKAHIAKYPNGKYTANAHYWLGEIYVLQNNLELARQSFSTVVDNYPIHRKASDSTFKLGQVYFMLGNKAKAKELLEKAAAGNDNASRLAKSYLEKNF